MTAVSDSDSAHGADSTGMLLIQCRSNYWCNNFPAGLGCCPQCASPGTVLHAMTEIQYQRSLLRPGPPT